MQKRDFETYQKRFRDFKIRPKFSETHVFWGTIRHPYQRRWIYSLVNSLLLLEQRKENNMSRLLSEESYQY